MDQKVDYELMTRIAWMYYYGGDNQEEIARKIKMSRLKVMRLLKQALDLGIVKIEIVSDHLSLYSLEKELKEKAALDHVVVVPTVEDLADAISRGAAHLFNDLFPINGSFGIGLSRTLRNFSRYLEAKTSDITSIVSLCGTTSPKMALTTVSMVYGLSEKLSVDFYAIWAPVIAASEADARSMKKDRFIASALRLAQDVDVALVAIGGLQDTLLMTMGYISEAESRRTADQGVVGEILGRYYTIRGTPIPTILDERLIAVRFPMECPVIGVAGGEKKVQPIVGAVRSGYIQGLVTDEKTARSVLLHLDHSD